MSDQDICRPPSVYTVEEDFEEGKTFPKLLWNVNKHARSDFIFLLNI
jgi:hypothetical protein